MKNWKEVISEEAKTFAVIHKKTGIVFRIVATKEEAEDEIYGVTDYGLLEKSFIIKSGNFKITRDRIPSSEDARKILISDIMQSLDKKDKAIFNLLLRDDITKLVASIKYELESYECNAWINSGNDNAKEIIKIIKAIK